MVFGAIINWTVGKTLDLTFDAIWWVTKKTGQGIVNAGQYLIIRKNNNEDNNKHNNEHNNDELISLIKEQNKLLTEEIRLLHNTQSNTEEIKEKEEIKEIKEKTD
jgi:hypothetical protein